MYKATLQLSAGTHGRYQLGMKTESQLEVILYGDDPEEIRRYAAHLLEETVGYPDEDRSDSFKESFRNMPSMLKDRLDRQSCSFSLQYDPEEFPPSASWAISEHSGDEIVVVVQ